LYTIENCLWAFVGYISPDQKMLGTTIKRYYDKFIITEQTIRNSRPYTVKLNKTIKGAHSIDAAIPDSHSLNCIINGKLQKDRLERRANKNMATENVLYNANSAVNGWYYSKLITWQLETAYPLPALSIF
jgi:hypothetical protein